MKGEMLNPNWGRKLDFLIDLNPPSAGS